MTEALVKQVQQALADHELIKVKIGAECPADRHEVADRLGREPGINVVQMVGRVLLLYKRHPQKPRYEGKRAQPGAPGKSDSKRGAAPSRSGRAPGKRRAPAARR